MLLVWESNSGKIQNSGQFQNNTINDVKQISLSHVIKWNNPHLITDLSHILGEG